ncbi:hypothetical protein BDZ89DRAFT_1079476, partial [Hymenopellis radicata]
MVERVALMPTCYEMKLVALSYTCMVERVAPMFAARSLYVCAIERIRRGLNLTCVYTLVPGLSSSFRALRRPHLLHAVALQASLPS